MKPHKTLLLGAHMSIAKGLWLAIERGESIGCTCIQIFTKSNRRLFAPPLTNIEIQNFKSAKKPSAIKQIIAHSGYLINVASPDKKKQSESIKALTEELERCALLDIPYLVLHPGACLGSYEDECLSTVAKGINTALKNFSGKTKILLENVAGEGTKIGHQFQQLAKIKSLVLKPIGFCFDTCHAFAAGHDFCSEKTYIKMWENFDKTLGIENLKAIHVNDSAKKLGARVDRHASIGDGEIGAKAFSLLMNDPRFFDTPKILETPKGKTLEQDIKNMETLKALLSEKTKEKLGLL